MEETNWVLQWIYPLAPLAGVIVGAFVVARLTRTRDHAAWLRDKRLEALAEFLKAADLFASNIATIDGKDLERAQDLRLAYTTLQLLSPSPLEVAVNECFAYLRGPDSKRLSNSKERSRAYLKESAEEIVNVHKVGQMYVVNAEDRSAAKALAKARKRKAD